MTASHEHVRDGASADDEQAEIRSILSTLTRGTVIDGKYRVDEVLGRGAMGVVVAVTHLQLGERAALKFLRIQGPANGEDFQSRFRREARLSARLRSEHITRVIDVGVWREKVPFMVMEYLTGGDLRALTRWTGPLPLDSVLDFATQICSGIAAAHALGAVHRDLKSSNVFVTQRPDGSALLKILDFGISKWGAETESMELTKTGVILGSPKYMAPEQLFGSAEVDARADVWSVGAIVYEMLTGRPPYDVPTVMRVCAVLSTNEMPPKIATVRDDVPEELEAALFKCFARDPAERVQNVAELAGSLLEAAGVPSAGPVRQRILQTLDPSRVRDPLLSSTGANAAFTTSGAFATTGMSASISGSTSASRSAPASVSASASASASVSASAAIAEPKPRRRALVWIALAVVLVGAIAVGFALRRGERDAVPAASASASNPTTAIAASTATTPEASAATTASVPASPAPTAIDAAATARATPRATQQAPHAKPTATTKEPATAAPPAPPPVTTSAPAQPPPTKFNPLEDRQ